MRGKPDREGGGAPARFDYGVSSLRLTALAGWRMPARVLSSKRASCLKTMPRRCLRPTRAARRRGHDRVHVDQEVQNRVPGHHVDAGQFGNVVSLGNAKAAIDLEMNVGQDHVAGLAGLQLMQAQHARRGEDFGGDCGDLLFVGGPVGEIVQRIPQKTPAHLADHAADDQRGDRIEQRKAQQVAGDADAHDKGRGGVGAGVLERTRSATASM